MTTKIRFSSLDFDGLKQSFINYLKTTAEFKDYNFEGSNINVFLNTLAYNSHYQSLMANFTANEMFLDTASKRSNIVSRAKELGYVPTSKKAAKAVVTVEFRNVFGNPSSLVLPKGSTFTGIIDDSNYTFTTVQSFSTTPVVENAVNVYRFSNIEIYEGVEAQNTILYNTSDYTIQIPNIDIDTSLLNVFVQRQKDSGYDEYVKDFNFLAIDGSSKVFFIQEGFNENYEIYFGDGIVGYKPANNSPVLLNYIVTSGIEGNNAVGFMLTLLPAGTESASINVITESASTGGKDRENEENIRLNALGAYGVQNRAVIPEDYSTIIKNIGLNVDKCIVWGGEDNIPPKFGYVMACIKPLSGDSITSNEKNYISGILRSKAVGNSRVEYVNPDYIDLNIETTATYDKSKLSVGLYELESEIISTIITYGNTYLNDFASTFRMSNLSSAVDKTNTSIISNLTNISVEKWLYPRLYSTYSVNINFSNSIQYMTSSNFTIPNNSSQMFFMDDGYGAINIVYYLDDKLLIHTPNVGTVDYKNGIINISNVIFTGYSDRVLKIKSSPISNDVFSTRNIILRLQNSNIKVKVTS